MKKQQKAGEKPGIYNNVRKKYKNDHKMWINLLILTDFCPKLGVILENFTLLSRRLHELFGLKILFLRPFFEVQIDKKAIHAPHMARIFGMMRKKRKKSKRFNFMHRRMGLNFVAFH